MRLISTKNPISRGVLYAVLTAGITLLGFATLYGCAGGNVPVRQQPQWLDQLTLPAPDELARGASYLEADREKVGAGFDAAIESWNVNRDGAAATFTPWWEVPYDTELSDTAYAYYPFLLNGYTGVPELLLTWKDGTGENAVYVGLANFTRNRWDWRAYPSTGPLDFGGLADYIDPGSGLLGVVVLAFGKDSSTLESLRIGPPLELQVFPQATLSADQLSGAPPLDVQFDSAQSSDTDGTITLYEVDKDNDGIFEESSPTPLAWSQHYSTEGRFTVTLRVTDDDSLTDTAQVTISTAADSGWVGVVMPGVPYPPAPIWDVAGLPAVFFFDGLNISFMRAQNAWGQSWDSPVNVEYSGSGAGVSAAVINGRPAIAYEVVGGMSFYLRYAVAKDSTGTSWNEPVFIANGPSYPSSDGQPLLFEVEGRPAILYQCESSGVRELYYFRASDAYGMGWSEGVLVGPVGVAAASTPCIVGGNPAVAFVWHNDAESRYEYAYSRATVSDGSEWGTEVQLLALAPGTPGDVSYGLDLVDAGGAPAVILCSGPIPNGAKELGFMRALDATGASWPAAPTALYTCGADDYLKWPVAANIGGNPAIAVVEWAPSTFGRIAYIRALTSDGMSWPSLEEVIRDETDILSEYPPYADLYLGMSGGYPAIVGGAEEFLFLTKR